MTNIAIDINCDLGEGPKGTTLEIEKKLMPYISSCNIACGGHAGDTDQMISVMHLAMKNDVNIGAHPSYPDRENFGRVKLKISPSDLLVELEYQIRYIKVIAENEGINIVHVKPHGALYNFAAIDRDTSDILIQAILKVDPQLMLYCPPNSITSSIATHRGIKVMHEGFIDRRYNQDGSLVNRAIEGAVIHNPEIAAQQFLQIVKSHKTTTIHGEFTPLHVQTLCVHGDNPQALDILLSCHQVAHNHNINIQPFI